MSKFCTRCGAEMNDDAMFCPKCGAPVSGQESTDRFNGAESANSYYGAGNGSGSQNYNYSYEQNSNTYSDPQTTSYEVRNTDGNFAGITKRDLALAIILSIVTCGIYGFYWMYKLNDEINYLSGEPNATGGGAVIILSIVTCGIYGLYWHYQMGKRVDRMKMNDGSSGVLYLLLAIFGLGIVNFALMQDAVNNVVG